MMKKRSLLLGLAAVTLASGCVSTTYEKAVTVTKDADGSRIFYEPLAAFDPDGNLVPVLAA